MEDWETKPYTCTGSTVINGETINCMGEHGEQTIAEGLGHSCNVLFAELAVDLGKEAMMETAKALGFNQAEKLDDIVVTASTYDVNDADANSLAWSGVGQYTDLVTPYHMMRIMGAIANGGVPVEPHLVSSMSGGGENYAYSVETGERMMSESTAQALQTMLRNNVASYYASGMFPSGMEVCAKTGTGEVGEDKEPNGWVAGFCANQDTPYAFAVVVEEGGFGSASAAPIASELLSQLQ